MSISNAIMDSHEPTLQFAHSLNRVLQSYGMELQSIEFYYSDDNFIGLIEAELKELLAEPMDYLARQAVEFALNSLPKIHGLSVMQGSFNLSSFSNIGPYLSQMERYTAPVKTEALIGISSNVYYVNFRTGRALASR